MATDAMPSRKNEGKTVPAVSKGCQAGSLCCLNALTIKHNLKLFFNYLKLLSQSEDSAFECGHTIGDNCFNVYKIAFWSAL